jgi:hypothetical protein
VSHKLEHFRPFYGLFVENETPPAFPLYAHCCRSPGKLREPRSVIHIDRFFVTEKHSYSAKILTQPTDEVSQLGHLAQQRPARRRAVADVPRSDAPVKQKEPESDAI